MVLLNPRADHAEPVLSRGRHNERCPQQHRRHRRGIRQFRSLFRHLKADHAWRWYSFAYFDEHTKVQPRSFLRDAFGDSERALELPAVSWIDPNFATHKHLPTLPPGIDGPGSNDDHPPVSVINGQKLVNKIYEALGRSEY
jgi:phosphoesterase family protein